jgi:hypothetical protein
LDECVGQPEAGKNLQNRPFDSDQREAPLVFFLANPIKRPQNLVPLLDNATKRARYCKQLQTFPKAVMKTSHRAPGPVLDLG